MQRQPFADGAAITSATRARIFPGLLTALAVIAGLVLSLQPWGAGSAHAHDVLVSSDPAAGATLDTAPTHVSLTFNSDVLTGVANQIQVQTPDGGSASGDGLGTVSGRVVSVPVTIAGGGTYSVAWHVVSSDGHPVEGAFEFTVAGPAAATASESASAGADDETEASTAPVESAQAPGADESSAVPWIIAGAVALLALVGIAVVLVRRLSSKKA